ncbi:MAG: hypothetical protein K2X82_06970, partial [Gemmataceae bacterium]|nr:hypothetical protein [Gemmataceae bacterium]
RRARASRRRRAARAVLVGAALVVVLQLGLGIAAERILYLKDPGYADKELRLARAEAAAPGRPTVLMLGTSRAGFAFHAGRVQDRLAADREVVAFNFGIPASGPVTHLIYLRRLLEDGHRPALLLVEVLPSTLSDLPPGPPECHFLSGMRLRRAEVEVAAGYGFPGKVRDEWRETARVPWYGLRFPLLGRLAPSALPWHLRFNWSRTDDPLGWTTPPLTEVTPQQYAEGLARARGEYAAFLADLRPAGGGARALADLVALCRAEGIPVRLVLLPEAAGFRAFYPPAALDRLDRFVQGLCAEHGCGLIDARRWLPEGVFTDGHHLMRPGAEAFSDRLADEAVAPFFREGH